MCAGIQHSEKREQQKSWLHDTSNDSFLCSYYYFCIVILANKKPLD